MTATMVGLLAMTPVSTAYAAEEVRVRVGLDGQRNRMVFDWPAKTPYRIVKGDTEVTIYFDKQGSMDLTAYRRQPLPMFKAVEWKPAGGGTVVKIEIPKGYSLNHFSLGNKVVVDIYGPKVSASMKPQSRLAAPPVAAPALARPSAPMKAAPTPAPKPDPSAVVMMSPSATEPGQDSVVMVPGSEGAAPAKTAPRKRRMAQAEKSKPKPEVHRPSRRDDSTTRGFSVGANASTLGFGGEVGYRLNDFFAVRAGGNYFAYDFDQDVSDIEYGISFNMMSGGAVVDLYPFGGGLRLTAGVRYNANGIDIKATPTTATEIGGVTYTPTEIGTMKGEISFWPVAPYAGLGIEWGMFGGHLRMAFDAGVYYQGSPSVDLSNNGTFAGNAAFQAELKKESDDIEDKLAFIQFYPVVGFTVAYRF